MEVTSSVNVRFYRLEKSIEPYFTALYLFDISSPDDFWMEDYLHPEWTAMRFSVGTPPTGAIGEGPLQERSPFVLTGPTTRALRFGLTRARIWGLGLQPAGWARYVAGDASDYADRIVDGAAEAPFAPFAPILDLVQSHPGHPDEVAAAIDTYLTALPHAPSPHESAILACHDASRDPDVSDVAELARRTGLTPRSLERLCKRYFGFPPKMVLRRQRFLRSLAHYMNSRTRSWSESLDRQYFDQAHFVRDFRSFMGMTPSEYADMPHPVIDRIIGQRLIDQGVAPPTDLPTVLRYPRALAGEE